MIANTAKEPHRLAELELERFGATHAEVGGHLLQLWGLPAPIVEAVALHHAPHLAAVQGFGPLAAIHAAEVVVDGEAQWDHKFLEQAGLAEQWANWTGDPAATTA